MYDILRRNSNKQNSANWKQKYCYCSWTLTFVVTLRTWNPSPSNRGTRYGKIPLILLISCNKSIIIKFFNLLATEILEFRSFSVTSNLGDLCWSSNFRKIVIIADVSGYEIICCAYSIESLTRCLFAELLASTFQQNRGQTSIRILMPESIQSSSMVTI